MKFEDYKLVPELLEGILKSGFVRPTDIQYKAIPHILRGEDIMAVAQTGTGKTGAFVIPILHRLHNAKLTERRKDGIKCIVLTPTHELAIQITEVFDQVGQFTNVKCFGIYGGVDQEPQIERLRKRTDVLIATPGRMFDLISQGHLLVHRVETLVLDESDHMLKLGFLKDIHDLIEKLPKRRQTLFFSATINKNIKKLAYAIVHQNAIRIQISPKNPVARNVSHGVAKVEMDDKRFFLQRLIEEQPASKILVFTRTKVRAERVLKAMDRVKIEAEVMHGDKTQEERTATIDRFRSGETKVLIATDITARGIDIPMVELVINYDIPEQADDYVHRIGRTGRGKEKGEAISFCSKKEETYLKEIEEYINTEIPIINISKTEYTKTQGFGQEQESLEEIMREAREFEEGKKLSKAKATKKKQAQQKGKKPRRKLM